MIVVDVWNFPPNEIFYNVTVWHDDLLFPFQILFLGERGRDVRGDIAVDTIEVTSGNCKLTGRFILTDSFNKTLYMYTTQCLYLPLTCTL